MEFLSLESVFTNGLIQGGKSLREEISEEGKFQEEGNFEGGKSEGEIMRG